MMCLLRTSLPPQSISMNIPSTQQQLPHLRLLDYGVLISVFLSHYLVDIVEVKIGHVLTLDSIANGKV
ncbi:putative trichome birefringence-like family [Helianthus annuus]|nr:putative trichome birefringence-like family [Helianthus annuus]